MSPAAQTFDLILGILVVLLQIDILFLVVIFFVKKTLREKIYDKVFRTSKYLLAGFLAALAAFVGSLTYSDIIGFTPCKLCWYQRIALYPLTLILGYGWARDDHRATGYALPFALAGVGMSLYHYIIQVSPGSGVDCAVAGYTSSCSAHFTLQFGYITIPMMALTIGVLISLLLIHRIRARRRSIVSQSN